MLIYPDFRSAFAIMSPLSCGDADVQAFILCAKSRVHIKGGLAPSGGFCSEPVFSGFG